MSSHFSFKSKHKTLSPYAIILTYRSKNTQSYSMGDAPEFLTVSQIAGLLQLTTSQMYEFMKADELNYLFIGGQRVITYAAAADFLHTRYHPRHQATEPPLILLLDGGIVYFTVQQCAETLAVTAATVYGWMRQGEIGYYQLGGVRRIPRAEVEIVAQVRQAAGHARKPATRP